MDLSNLNKKLSDIPSELLTQALNDLKLCENNPNVEIDMSTWCYSDGVTCYVCLAGATVYNNIEDNISLIERYPNKQLFLSNIEDNIQEKLKLLDDFKNGNVTKGLSRLNISNAHIEDREISPYLFNNDQFYKDMYRLVEDLKKVGL